jgi:hypothetical protein
MALNYERVIVDDAGLRDLSNSDAVRDFLLEVAEPIVDRARALAPKRSGRGAASIHAEDVHDGFQWTVRIGWTRDRYYMRFQDQGWENHAGREFLIAALEGAT